MRYLTPEQWQLVFHFNLILTTVIERMDRALAELDQALFVDMDDIDIELLDLAEAVGQKQFALSAKERIQLRAYVRPHLRRIVHDSSQEALEHETMRIVMDSHYAASAEARPRPLSEDPLRDEREVTP